MNEPKPPTVRAVLEGSHSVHVFAYTFNRLTIEPGSVYARLLGESWPPAAQPMCQCVHAPAPPVVNQLVARNRVRPGGHRTCRSRCGRT